MSSYFDKTTDTTAGSNTSRNYFAFGTYSATTTSADTRQHTAIAVLGQDAYTTTARRYSLETIPGSYAPALSDDGGFQEVKVTYHCGISLEDLEDITVDGIEEELNTFLSNMIRQKGWQKLVDSFHEHYFRLAVLAEAPRIEPIRNAVGGPYTHANFDLTFTCKPQRFLEGSDEFVAVESGNTVAPAIEEPAIMVARPKLMTSGSGTITIGSQEIDIHSDVPSGTIIIDCEAMDAYRQSDGKNLNKYVTMPIQTVELDGFYETTVTYTTPDLYIAPMWWSA